MANARFAWGIDIGNRALKAVKLVPEGTGYRIDDFDIIEHETVLSNAGDNKESLIQSALATFAGRHPTKGGVAAVGVSGQSSFARFIKLPPVEPKKIPEIVRFEAIQQIPFPLEEVEWSYQLFQQPDSPDVEVGIFAMRKELVNRQLQFYTDVDMNVQVVQMSPLAVYNAMYYDGRIDGTTMIVDLGAENADLIIAEGEGIWLRSIPIGGNNFTEALVKAFKVNFQKAEELKRTAATSKYQRQIFQAMRPVFADLVGEIQRSIGFYASVHRESRINKVIALGGTFRLPTLQKYLSQNLQVNVERVDNFGAGAPADPKVAGLLNENILSCAAAYGLAMQAQGEGKITSSLLPEAIRREKMWRDKTKWFAVAAGLVVAATAVKMVTVKGHEFALNSAENEGHKATIQRVTNEATDLDKKWAEVESAGAADRQLITQIMALQDYRLLWKNLMVDIGGIATAGKPQPEVLSGDPEQIKSIPRPERNVVWIQGMKSRYVPDLARVIAMSPEDFQKEAASGGSMVAAGPEIGAGGMPAGLAEYLASQGLGSSAGRSPAPPPAPKAAAPKKGKKGDPAPAAVVAKVERGFVITVQCVTPQNVEFVQRTVIPYLQAINEEVAYPDRRYLVRRVAIADVKRVGGGATDEGQETTTARRPRQAAPVGAGGPDIARQMIELYGGGGNRPAPTARRPREPAKPVEPDQIKNDPWRDPLTGEDTRGDYEVTLVMAVVLDPVKKAPGQSTATASAVP